MNSSNVKSIWLLQGMTAKLWLACNNFLFLFLLIALSLLTLQPLQAHAGITINKVVDYHENKQLMIDSESSFDLPDNIIEAIYHEVPLSFKITIELTERSSVLGFKYQRMRKKIEFHTQLYASGVNRLYSLYNSRNHKSQTFKTLEEALQTLATLRAFPVLSLAELHPEQRYTLRMRIQLDKWKLPTPLLIEAIFTDNWLLDSQWYEEQLQTPLSWQ